MTSPLDPSLTRKLILRRHPEQRINNDAALLANEILRLFIVEARQRAAVEAECEHEGEQIPCDTQDDAMTESDSDDEKNGGVKSAEQSKERRRSSGAGSNTPITIRADHIVKVAAELLMDFS